MSARTLLCTVLVVAATGVAPAVADAQYDYGYYPACDPAPDHPIQLAIDVPGHVVACVSEDRTSMHLRNVSPYVLIVGATGDYSKPYIEEVREPYDSLEAAGIVAAQQAVPSGWYDDGRFVLSLDESAVVTGDGPFRAQWRPSPILTAEANMTRWTVGQLTDQLETWEPRPFQRGGRLYRGLATCADESRQAATKFATEGATLGNVLTAALSGAGTCGKFMKDAMEAIKEPAFKQYGRDVADHMLHQVKPHVMQAALAGVARFLTS